MMTPTLFDPCLVAPDTELLPAYTPVPGLGVLPVNAYLLRAAQPVLVDAGHGALRGPFMERLRAAIDPEDLRWIWLTHTDPDHVGALPALLAEAPNARVVTSYLGLGKLGLLGLELPPERVYLLNPGQRLDVGDRELLALRPPLYDAPETTAAFDPVSRALFSSDCFGALMEAPRASALDIPPDELARGLITWASVDAPWLAVRSAAAHRAAFTEIEALAPEIVLSSHLPPAPRMTATLIAALADAPSAPAFRGPDQAALEAMLSAA